MAFRYINNDQLEDKMEEKIPFKMATKKDKILKKHLRNTKILYEENFIVFRKTWSLLEKHKSMFEQMERHPLFLNRMFHHQDIRSILI